MFFIFGYPIVLFGVLNNSAKKFCKIFNIFNVINDRKFYSECFNFVVIGLRRKCSYTELRRKL